MVVVSSGVVPLLALPPAPSLIVVAYPTLISFAAQAKNGNEGDILEKLMGAYLKMQRGEAVEDTESYWFGKEKRSRRKKRG